MSACGRRQSTWTCGVQPFTGCVRAWGSEAPERDGPLAALMASQGVANSPGGRFRSASPTLRRGCDG